jgi:hypothetical protein
MAEPAGADPEIDLIIAVHSKTRPIRRAVQSALAAASDAERSVPTRITIVCHDLERSAIADALGDLGADGRLRLIEHRDGVRSPSGPFNAGLDAATAPWVSIMGSDDELETGALVSWLSCAERSDAQVVLPRLITVDGAGRRRAIATPPARPGRRARLDGVRDRLAYRSAPLGLLNRSLVGGLRFGLGLPQGEDVLFSARLWFSGASIALCDGPSYLVHQDARDRVTSERPPIAESLRFVSALLDDRWFRQQSGEIRTALGAKLIRVNVLGEFVNRSSPEQWTASERDSLALLTREILSAAPSVKECLPIADLRLIEAIPSASGIDAVTLLRMAQTRRRFGRRETLVTKTPRGLLNREAPIRFIAASLIAGRRS